MKITCTIEINTEKLEDTSDFISDLSTNILDFLEENEQTYFECGAVLIKSEGIVNVESFGIGE